MPNLPTTKRAAVLDNLVLHSACLTPVQMMRAGGMFEDGQLHLWCTRCEEWVDVEVSSPPPYYLTKTEFEN